MPPTRSLSIHGALTEDVCENVSGKGREGNKEGKGTRVETSHHGVAYLTRAAAAPAPVEPRDDMMTGLSVIEGIDLDAEVQCEAEWFCPNPDSHAAHYLVRENCDQCRLVEVLAYCSAAWAEVFTYETLECDRCEDLAPPAEVMRIVEVLR